MLLSLYWVLRQAQERLLQAVPSSPVRPATCLTFAAARQVVLSPETADPLAKAHLQECAACRQLVARFAEGMPHLPWWALLQSDAVPLSPTTERAVQYHLTEAQCTLCRSRQVALGKQGVWLPNVAWQTSPHAAHASEAPRTRVHYVPAGAYEVGFTSVDPHLVCEIRTKEPRFQTYLFGSIVCRQGAAEKQYPSYTVLSTDVNGWYTGQLVVTTPGVPSQSGARNCDGIYVQALSPEELYPDDTELILTAIGPALAQAETGRRWREWVQRVAPTLTPTSPLAPRQLIAELELRLG